MGLIIINARHKETKFKNYDRSVKGKVDKFWGFKLTDRQGKKVVVGDYLCFYFKREIKEIMKVTKIERDEEKSLATWDHTIFKNIVYLDKIKDCNMKWSRIKELLELKHLWGLRYNEYINIGDDSYKDFMLELGINKKDNAKITLTKEGMAKKQENNKKIGDIGELAVVKFLKETYSDVTHTSITREFEKYDIEYTDNGKKYYVEVKSTRKKKMEEFFVSQNEYEFYLDNKDNYKLYCVEGVSLKKNNKNKLEIKEIEPSKVFIKNNMLPIKWKVKTNIK